MTDPETLSRLYQVKINQLAMLEDRGFDTSPDDFIAEMSEDEFIDYILRESRSTRQTPRDILTKMYSLQTDPNHKVVVFYPNIAEGSLSVPYDDMKRLVAFIGPEATKAKKGIMISEVGLNSPKKSIFESEPDKYQHFTELDLSYNPTLHYLVPKHIGLTVDEGRRFLQENRINGAKLPVILRTDPIAKWYWFPIGTIVRIERENLSFETMVMDSISYRIVK